MTQDLESLVHIGQVVESKYRVDRVLGIGGMGVVVAATHLQLDRLVALKLIQREAMANHDVVSRFEREARAAVRLRSEHAARIFDVGRLDNAVPYIVMEYLEGQDLAAVLQQQGALPIAVACDYIVQACDAIAEAHGLGIVHRDLKPGNLFLATTSHGLQSIKVLDFGISKTQAIGDPSMTRTQVVMGSPGYMSPEQMRSAKNVDGRTDIWSLGILLYELVSGRVPFQADTFTALCVKVAIDPPPPLPALPSSLPAGFEVVIHRALAKDPQQRHASASELAQALAPFGTAQTRERAQRLASAPAVVQASGSLRALSVGDVVREAQGGKDAARAEPAVPSTLRGASGEIQTGASSTGRRLRRQLLTIAGSCCAALALGFALVRGGSAGDGAHDPQRGAQLPKGPSGMQTPGVQSPGVQSPGVQSPGVQSPGVQSPGVQSPAAAPAPAAPRAAAPHPAGLPHSSPASTGPSATTPVDAGIDAKQERVERRRPNTKPSKPDVRPPDSANPAQPRIDPYGSPD